MANIFESKYKKKLESITFAELKSLYDTFASIEIPFNDFCHDITKWSNKVCRLSEIHKLTDSETIVLSNAKKLSKELQLLEPTDNILERIKIYSQIVDNLTAKTNYTLPNNFNGEIVDMIFKYSLTLSSIKSNDAIDKRLGINRWKLINDEKKRRQKIKYIDDCIAYLHNADVSMDDILSKNEDDIVAYAHLFHYLNNGKKLGCSDCEKNNIKKLIKYYTIDQYYESHWKRQYYGLYGKTHIFKINNGEFDIYSSDCDHYCKV